MKVPEDEAVQSRLVDVDVVRLLIMRSRFGTPFHKLPVGLLVLFVDMVFHSVPRANISKASCNFVALEPRHLVHCQGGDLKRVLVCVKNLKGHGRADNQTKLASNSLM